MSKKYVIEIEDEPFVRQSALHGEESLYRVHGFKSLVFDKEGLNILRSNNPEIVHCYECRLRQTYDCPMYHEDYVSWEEDGYIESDEIIEDNTINIGFCDRGER